MKKSEYIKLLKSFGLITGIIFIIYSCRGTNEKKIQTEIDHIAAKWVPDGRVGVCNVKKTSGEKKAVFFAGETTNLAAKNEIIKTLNNQSKTLIDSIIFLPDTIRNII